MKVLVTKNIEIACQAALANPDIDTALRVKLNTQLNNEQPTDLDANGIKISVESLKELSTFLLKCETNNGNEKAQSKFWVHELLKGSKVCFDVLLPKPRSDTLEQRLQNIARDMNNQEYYRMVSGVDPNFSVPATPRNPDAYANAIILSDSKETKQQITAIINILFTIVAVFVAVYWVSYAVTNVISWRVLMSLFSSIFVGAAETFLYIRYLQKQSSQMRSL